MRNGCNMLPRRCLDLSTVATLAVAVGLSTALLASDFPAPPTKLPIQFGGSPVLPHIFGHLVGTYRSPRTKAELDALGLSGTLYLQMLAHLDTTTTAIRATTTSSVASISSHENRSRFKVSGLTASGPTMINSDVNEDREPVYTTVHNGNTHAEVQYAAWIYFDGNPNSTNFHVKASSNGGGGWTAPVALLGPRMNSSDPMLSANNYVAGFHPQTTYCVTLSYDYNPATGVQGVGGILVWQNNGSGWSYQELPETHDVRVDGLFMDKPSITVSQDSAAAGSVFVAFQRVQLCPSACGPNPPPPSIGFALFDDTTPPAGQWKIRTDVPTPSGHVTSSPIVVSDPTSSELLGAVYVLYLDYSANQVVVYYSADKGASWSFFSAFDIGQYGIHLASSASLDPRICSNRSAGDCVFAPSIISARYNWHSSWPDPSAMNGSIGLVLNAWDGTNLAAAKMHSYFLRWNPMPPCGSACRGFDQVVSLT